MNPWITILAMSLAAGAISMTIAKSQAFEPLRDWVKARSEWFGDLIHCPYCVSHYVAIFFVGVYQPLLLPGLAWAELSPIAGAFWPNLWPNIKVFGPFFVNLVISVFTTVAITAPICGVIYKSIAVIAMGSRNDEEDFE